LLILNYAQLQPSGTLIHHPKSHLLGLIGEKIVGISACGVRASLWTESGKVNIDNWLYLKEDSLHSILFFN